ncbi:hypothetical protein [Actinomadura chokoriensis]|uniref:hypothetical protein n=1 Tax=Actinomadura chokoriensis TaxID=454156 RepID=UPI0031F93133
MRVAALDIAGPRHPPEGDDTAIRAGEVLHDGHGVAGCSVTTAFRLLEAPPLKDALRDSPGVADGVLARLRSPGP